jgi:regulator of replication initiation timing
MNVSLDISAGGDGEELRRLREENAMLRHRLGEVEASWEKAREQAKGLQGAQQRLFQVGVFAHL